MIKLIITDVDDTLVPEGGSTLRSEYYELIREFRARGVIFGVASGRQKPSVKKLFEPVLDDIFILADNGTDIWAKDFQMFTGIEDDVYQDLVKNIQKMRPEYSIMACKPDISYAEYGHEGLYNYMLNYPYVIEYVEDAVKLTDICKVSAWCREGIHPEDEERMKARWGQKLDVFLSGKCFLDFTSKGCNKGKALSIVQEHYGIQPEETVAFGNASNDIPMLKQAKYSYAVKAASENVKEVASEVIGEMKDDAVLEKLREILENIPN